MATLTPRQYARWLQKRPDAIRRGIQRADAESLDYAATVAKRASRGRYSSARLAAMGHPYSRRNPRPPQDPAIINRQSGLFLQSWWTAQRWTKPNNLLNVLTNTAPYAGYLRTGTRRMIARPIADRIVSQTAMSRLGRQIYYIHRALTR